MKLSPGVNIDDVAGPTPLPKAWDKKMKFEDAKEKEPRDLDIPLIDLENEGAEDPSPEEEEDQDDPDMILEIHAAALHGLPQDCAFTFLYQSSEDSNRDESLASLADPPPSSDDLQKQGVSRIP